VQQCAAWDNQDHVMSSASQHRSAHLDQPAKGLDADGWALSPDAAGREALRAAMLNLSQVHASTGGQPGLEHAAALCSAQTDAARALAAMHAYSAAESFLKQALHWATVMAARDTQADLHCALAEVAANTADLAEAQGDTATSRLARSQARDRAIEVSRLAGSTADPHWEVRVLLRASDVLDRCGDHDDAVHIQHRAMELMGLTDTEQAGAQPLDPLRLAAPTALM
jgi:hypothetical protein